VLDTDVLIHDPRSVFNFGDNDVIIPFVVLEELDRLQRGMAKSPHRPERCSGSWIT
jgi:PhoH-like ATPase